MELLNIFSAVISPLATSTVVGVIIGALLNGAWNRRSAKKVPKTEMRAAAYRDFVAHVISHTSSQNTASNKGYVPNSGLDDIKARLVLFGESNVVSTVAQFLSQHRTLNNADARIKFTEVICQMRKSLLTGHGETVMESISTLLAIPMPGHNQSLDNDVSQASLQGTG
jgi:hypothetical protein